MTHVLSRFSHTFIEDPLRMRSKEGTIQNFKIINNVFQGDSRH